MFDFVVEACIFHRERRGSRPLAGLDPGSKAAHKYATEREFEAARHITCEI